MRRGFHLELDIVEAVAVQDAPCQIDGWHTVVIAPQIGKTLRPSKTRAGQMMRCKRTPRNANDRHSTRHSGINIMASHTASCRHQAQSVTT